MTDIFTQILNTKQVLFIEKDSYVIPAPGSAVIWLVMNTATLYSKEVQNENQTWAKSYNMCLFATTKYFLLHAHLKPPLLVDK